MRKILLCLLITVLAGCASPAPAPQPKDDEVRQQCLARMYSARMRGAVHWHIYENCLRDHS
jgi:uncharacterized protein YceK